MTITPQDIHHKEFKSARFGGYNEEEVDSFLDLVADELERLIHVNEDLTQQLEAARKRVQEFEEMQNSLQNALLTASKAAEVMKEQARQESEALIEKARQDSEAALNRAREQARDLISKAQAERTKIEREIARLKEIRGSYLDSLREIAASHLREAERILESEKSDVSSGDIRYAGSETAIEDVLTEEKESVPAIEHVEEAKGDSREIADQQETTIAKRISDSDKRGQSSSETVERKDTPEQTEAKIDVDKETEEDVTRVKTEKTPELKQGGNTEIVDQGSGDTKRADLGEETVSSSDLINEILGAKDEENPYVELLGLEEDEKERGKRGRVFRREKKERDLFWE